MLSLPELLSRCVGNPTQDPDSLTIENLTIIHPTTSWFSKSSASPAPSQLQLTFANKQQAEDALARIRSNNQKQADEKQPDRKQADEKQTAATVKKRTLTLPFTDLLHLLPINELKARGIDEQHLTNIRTVLRQLGQQEVDKPTALARIENILLGDSIDADEESSKQPLDADSKEQKESSSDSRIQLEANPSMRAWTLARCPFDFRYNHEFRHAWPKLKHLEFQSFDREEATHTGQIKITFFTQDARDTFTEVLQEQTHNRTINEFPDKKSVVIDTRDLLKLYPSTATGDAAPEISESDYFQYIQQSFKPESSDPLRTLQLNDLLAQLPQNTANLRVLSVDPVGAAQGNVQIYFSEKKSAKDFIDRLCCSPAYADGKKPEIQMHFQEDFSIQWKVEIPATDLSRLFPSNSDPRLLPVGEGEKDSAKYFINKLHLRAQSSQTTKVNPVLSPEKHIREMFNTIDFLQIDEVSISSEGVRFSLSKEMVSKPSKVEKFKILCTKSGKLPELEQTKNGAIICTFSFSEFERLLSSLPNNPEQIPKAARKSDFSELGSVAAHAQTMFQIASTITQTSKIDPEQEPKIPLIFKAICDIFSPHEDRPQIDFAIGAVSTANNLRLQFVPAMEEPATETATLQKIPSILVTTATPNAGSQQVSDAVIQQALEKHIQAELISRFYQTVHKIDNNEVVIEDIVLNITGSPKQIELAKQHLANQTPRQIKRPDPKDPTQTITVKLGTLYVNGEKLALSSAPPDPKSGGDYTGPSIEMGMR